MKTAKTESELIKAVAPYIADGYEIAGYTRYLVTLCKRGEVVYISRI